MKRRIPVVLALLAAGVVGGGYYVYERLWQSDDNAIVLYGNIDIRQVDVAFNVEGRIETMLFEEGDQVKRGQLLATLDRSRFENTVDAASAEVLSRRAVLERLEAGSRPEEIEKARADVRAAEAAWEEAKATLGRRQRLYERGVASAQELDDAQAAERAARARLEALQEALELVVIGPRVEDIREARAKLHAAQAELALARDRLRDANLYAPADAVVLTRIQEPGAVVLANTPIYSLALGDPIWARTYVSETHLGRVHPGMKVRITTDSFPDRTYAGWVGFISPTAEFTPKSVETPEIRTSLVYRLRVYVRNPDQTLRQGMPVTIQLLAEETPSAPQEAAPEEASASP